nr:MAG TPA: hypothetical protein [Caudoviricetes sp.]
MAYAEIKANVPLVLSAVIIRNQQPIPYPTLW